MAGVYVSDKHSRRSKNDLWVHIPPEFLGNRSVVSLHRCGQMCKRLPSALYTRLLSILAVSILNVNGALAADGLFVSGRTTESAILTSQIPIHLPWQQAINLGSVTVAQLPENGQVLDSSGAALSLGSVVSNQNITYVPDVLFLGDDLLSLEVGGTSENVNIYVFDEYRDPPTVLDATVPGGAANAQFGSAVALSADGKTLVVGAPRDSTEGSDRGSIKAYKWIDRQWRAYGEPLFGTGLFERFGASLDMDATGSTVIVGSPKASNSDGRVGSASVYTLGDAGWEPIIDSISGSSVGDDFGASTTISRDGHTIAIGAPYNDDAGTSAGAVYSYRINNGTLIPLPVLYGDEPGDYAGWSVALSATGSTLAFGAIGDDGTNTLAGQVKVFQLLDDEWVQKGSDLNGESLLDRSGRSIALSSDGNVVAIGARSNSGSGESAGHVRVYEYDGFVWRQLGNDLDGRSAGDNFGSSLSLSGDGYRIAVGSQLSNGNGDRSGETSVFHFDTGQWVATSDPILGDAGDYLGWSVALSEDARVLVTGSPNSDITGLNSGEIKGFNVIKDVYVPNIAPKTVAVEATPYSYTFELESDYYALGYSATNLPVWSDFDPSERLLSGTPGAENVGLHEDVTLWVDDGHGLSVVAQFDLTVLADFDLDGLPNECPLACLDAGFSQDSDDDADGVPDTDDAFPLDASESVDSDNDGVGDNTDVFPLDSNEAFDSDGDGVGDNADLFPLDPSESADTDGDGVGDNADFYPNNPNESADSDGDGVGDNADAFPNDGSETIDTDGDGVGDNSDLYPLDPNESADSDGDGVGDNADEFPQDPGETADTDGDGVGDNSDLYPLDPDESADSDGDGVGDNADAFPQDSDETIDSDSDGVGDNSDEFPDDASESADTDNDGVGDNADAFPDDPSETLDSDGDGVGDNTDEFPDDPSENTDSDGDGVGDNDDAFPLNPAESVDSDGDGTGDNADVFPLDPTEDVDTDGDGVGDNTDAFPTDETESLDTDQDGVGDNSDDFPDDPTETFDSDGDGVGDQADQFPMDNSESIDSDGDGLGNNQDLDDDNDGFTDLEEVEAGSNPLDSRDEPIRPLSQVLIWAALESIKPYQPEPPDDLVPFQKEIQPRP